MLYFIYGNNTIVAKKKQQEVLTTLRAKRPNSSFVVLDNENFTEAKLDELIQGGGLFDEKHIIALNNLFSDKIWSEVVRTRIAEMTESQSAFVCREENVDAKALKEIEKRAYKVLHFGKKEEGRWRDESVVLFAIGDAVGEGKGEKAWALYQKALRKDFSTEEIHGAIFWQIKSIAIAKRARSASESGLSPFVFQKSSRYAKNFEDTELKDALHALVSLYHDSRSEDGERLETGLEKFLLEKP